MDQALQPQLASPSLEDSLRLGQGLHLEFEGLSELNGGYHLWGICPNQSIMVSAPQLSLKPELLNTPVKARLFIEQFDSACAFRSSVVDFCSNPSSYLHLAMPISMVTGEVRRNHRARISVPCDLISYDGKKHLAEMIDASICGCRINTSSNDLKVGDVVSMAFEISIYGIKQKIELTAMIRSRAETMMKPERGYALGAQFLAMSDCHRIAMSSFIHKHC